jgi:mRNA interferase MazF
MTPHNPRRGEVWKIDFNPTRGAEIQKQRPAIVISSDAMGKLPLKIVAPITEWNWKKSSKRWRRLLNGHSSMLPSYQTSTERMEQQGFADLIKGIIDLFRDITTHAPKIAGFQTGGEIGIRIRLRLHGIGRKVTQNQINCCDLRGKVSLQRKTIPDRR